MIRKITIISPVYPYRGGIANFTEILYSHLKEKAEVSLVNFVRQYPDFLFPGKTQFDTETKKDIPSKRLIDSINPFTWKQTAKEILRDNPVALVFAYWHPFFAPAYGKIAKAVKKKNPQIKIVALCHNVLPHEQHFWDIPVTKFFFNNVDKVITLSEKVIVDLQKVKPNAKYKVLFHPVYSNFGEAVEKSTAREKLNLPENEKILLYFGFIRKYKGLDILLKAAAILKKKMNFKLIVAGEFYDNKNNYLKIIDDLALADSVIIRDLFIPAEDVKYYFSASDVVVLPYRSATQSGIVQMANNFRKPVIATNVGGLSEIIKNGVNGFVVEPENPNSLAEAIFEFYEGSHESKFISNIKIDVEKYSWENFTEQFLNFIEE